MSGNLRVDRFFRAQRAVTRQHAALEKLEDDFDAAGSMEAELRINDEIADQRVRLARALRRLERI